MDSDKRPLGATPYFINASARIAKLSEAIYRYSGEPMRSSTPLIKEWAKEIIAQCDLVEKMEKTEGLK